MHNKIFPMPRLEPEVANLVPPNYLEKTKRLLDSQALLTVNPNFWINSDCVWIRDTVNSLVTCYKLTPSSYAWLKACSFNGGFIRSNLSWEACFTLLLAGILIEAKTTLDAHCAYRRAVRDGANTLHQHGFAVLPRILPPLMLSFMRRHYRNLVSSGTMHLGDRQSALRYVAHNERLAFFIHRQLTPTMIELAGVPLKPSYSYFACYQPRASLPRHTDREQCEYSVSICIDYMPEPNCKTPWPLWLQTNIGELPIYQALGDALFYRGRYIPHFREQLPEMHQSTSLFFHYVLNSYVGQLN